MSETATDRMHVFKVFIEGHGEEEVAFFAPSRGEAREQLQEWLGKEPFVHNAPCAWCDRTDMPLHTDCLCPDCHAKAAEAVAKVDGTM